MAQILGLPKLSPTMEEGTLTRWIKREGDEIALDDIIAELETDKATMEWHAFEAGVLLKILVPEGTTLTPDAPVAILGARGEDISELLQGIQNAVPPPNATSESDTESHASVGDSAADKKPREIDLRQTPVAEAASDEAAEPEISTPPPHHGGSKTPGPEATSKQPKPTAGRVPASPSVRRLAREQGVDLASVHGTGPRGRIIQRDLEHALDQRAHTRVAETGASSASRPMPKVVPLSPTRRTIARRLTEAKRSIPHFYLNVDVDAKPLQRARKALNRALETEGEKLSFNDLIILACANALRRFPAVNVSFAEDALHQHQVVDIALAVAVPDGLVTPIIRDADRKGAVTIAREVRELVQLAHSKQLKPEQMTDGTFSISNLGMYGVDDFSAIINPPQAAILAVGAIRSDDASKTARMRLTLSCDHRAIDGAVGAEWLASLRSLLENPIRLLL